VDTVNVDSRAPTYLLLLLRCTRGNTLSYKSIAPDQGANRIGNQSEDPIPNKAKLWILAGAKLLSNLVEGIIRE
jgi:hypothetical protein